MAKIPGQKPRYQLLHDELLQQIQNGQYDPGDLLSSESELIYTVNHKNQYHEKLFIFTFYQ
jgi:DNA-binding GntR family transcriptional regulator